MGLVTLCNWENHRISLPSSSKWHLVLDSPIIIIFNTNASALPEDYLRNYNFVELDSIERQLVKGG